MFKSDPLGSKLTSDKSVNISAINFGFLRCESSGGDDNNEMNEQETQSRENYTRLTAHADNLPEIFALDPSN